MKPTSDPGKSWPLKSTLGVIALALILVAGAVGWARSRSSASKSAVTTTEHAVLAAPINDSAAETWRVLPAPAPPRAAPRARSKAEAPPAPEPDWGALSAGLADDPDGSAISLGPPAEVESGLSASEREGLIAADQDGHLRPERGRSKGTVVVGRGTPRGGGGRGRCD